MAIIKRIIAKLLDVIIYYPYNNLRFAQFGKNSRLISPLKIDCPKRIIIGKNVAIQYKTWLAAVPLTGHNDCCLEIGDGSVIGHFNHIYATKKIVIGKNVLTADKVYISDNQHGYENITIPIIKQNIIQLSNVTIGDGVWIGENVCIIGASIGKGSVIGANSVVTKNIPDHCVAVGAPARIVKKYNFDTEQWEKI